MTNTQQLNTFITAAFDEPIASISEINAGHNNRLFRVALKEGRQVLAKVYQKDDRNRLDREFEAFHFLHTRGFTNVPKAYFRNDSLNLAVYSFEIGQTKPAAAFTHSDVTQVIDFLILLHSLPPEDVNVHFPPAVMACFTIRDYLDNIEGRLNSFLEAAAMETAPRQVILIHQLPLREIVQNACRRVIKGYSKAELRNPITPDNRRLSPMDFGPFNMLFRPEGSICFVDFEYFGWDDPLRIIADFINHDRTRGLSKELKRHALEHYESFSSLPDMLLARLPLVVGLMAIEWLTVHLTAMTPQKIKARRFADEAFDLDSYLDEQVYKVQARIDEVVELKL